MSFTGHVQPHIDFEYIGSTGLSGGFPYRVAYGSADASLTDGSGDNQSQILYIATRTVTTASTNDDLDVAGGLTDVFGKTLTFTEIKELFIYNKATVAGDELTVGGSSNGVGTMFKGSATGKVTVKRGGHISLGSPHEGYVVTASTGDIIRVTHSGHSSTIDYDIIIIGVGTAV